MKQLILLVAACVALPALANGSHAVRGYVKKDGTYVAPSFATNPNDTKLDNYSTVGNVNPYTGKAGTVNPYATPTYRAPALSMPTYQAPTYQAPSTLAPSYTIPVYGAPKR